MITNFRQGLITSPVNFLIASGGFAHINIDQVPLLACISNAASDYLISEPATVNNAWGPINNSATHYLYWDINRVTGQVTRGMTMFSPVTSDSPPSAPAVGQMWWNYSQRKMNEWNGNRWVEVLRVFAGELTGSSIRCYDAGSQVGINEVGTPGKIVFDGYGKPLRMQNGNFLTSETELTLPQSGSLVKLDGAFITAKANENLPKNSIVYFVPNSGNRVGLASGVYPEVETKTPVGLVQVATYMNDPVNLVTAGKLAQDEQWNWNIADIGKPVYCDATGALTLERSGEKTMRIGTIFSQKSVMLSFDWETQPSTVAGEVVDIHATEPLYINGSQAAPIVNIKTVSATNGGALTYTQYNTIMAAVNEVPNKSNLGHTHVIAEVAGLQTTLDAKAPLSHTHVAAQITDLQPLLDGKSDVGHGHTIGDVSGLATALAGKANVSHTHGIPGVIGLQAALDDKANVLHNHEISQVNGLQIALDNKASVTHTHDITDVINLQATLDNKTDIGHIHSIAAVVGLQAALDDKALVSHTHFISEVQGLSAALDGKSNVGHMHAIADTSGLQAALDSKSDVGHQHAIGEITGLQIVLDNKADINHDHSLASLLDVNIEGVSNGSYLRFDSGTSKWVAGGVDGGGGTVAVGEFEIGYGEQGTGNITSSPSFKYIEPNRSFYVNVPDVQNEQSEVIIRTGNNNYGYGRSQLLMTTSFQFGASDVYLSAGNSSLDPQSLGFPGGAPNIKGGDINISAGNGNGMNNTGGSVFITAGNATASKWAGDVNITAGVNPYDSQYNGTMVLGGASVNIQTLNSVISVGPYGQIAVNGSRGSFGQVLTSGGDYSGVFWNDASGGGMPPPSNSGFVAVSPSLQYEVLSDQGLPAIPASAFGVPQMVPANIPNRVLTSVENTIPSFNVPSLLFASFRGSAGLTAGQAENRRLYSNYGYRRGWWASVDAAANTAGIVWTRASSSGVSDNLFFSEPGVWEAVITVHILDAMTNEFGVSVNVEPNFSSTNTPDGFVDMTGETYMNAQKHSTSSLNPKLTFQTTRTFSIQTAGDMMFEIALDTPNSDGVMDYYDVEWAVTFKRIAEWGDFMAVPEGGPERLDYFNDLFTDFDSDINGTPVMTDGGRP